MARPPQGFGTGLGPPQGAGFGLTNQPGVVFDRASASRIAQTVRAVERSPLAGRGSRGHAPVVKLDRAYAAVIVSRLADVDGFNAIYWAQAVASEKVQVQGVEPLRLIRLTDSGGTTVVNYVPANVGDVCLILEHLDGTRELVTPTEYLVPTECDGSGALDGPATLAWSFLGF